MAFQWINKFNFNFFVEIPHCNSLQLKPYRVKCVILVQAGRRGGLRSIRSPDGAIGAPSVPGASSSTRATDRTSSGRVNVPSHSGVWRHGWGARYGGGILRASRGPGGVPHVLVPICLWGRVATGRGGARAVRGRSRFALFVVGTVVDLLAGGRDARVVRRVLGGASLMQVVVGVGRHSEGQGEASIGGSGWGLVVVRAGWCSGHHSSRLVRMPVESRLLEVGIHFESNFWNLRGNFFECF